MENTKFTTIGIKAVEPRADDDNLIIKEMGNSRSDYMEQIDAQFEKIFDIIASMQLHLQTQERTEGNGSRYDFCVEDTKSQHQIVAATTQAATNPASLANLESSLSNDLPPWVCSHENNIEECCFVEAPLPTPFLSQPPKCSHFMPPLLASDHKIEEKSGYSHDVSVFMEKIEVDIAEIGYGISSNTLSAIVEEEIVLNPFAKETSSETVKLFGNGWVNIEVYGVFNDPNVHNYLFLNKCFEVRKVNGGLNFNFRYRRKKRWSCEWREEWLKLTEKFEDQFVNGWKNSQDDLLLSSVGLDGNSVVYLALHMKPLLLGFLAAKMAFYEGSFYLVTTDWSVVIHGFPIMHNFNEESYGFRNSGFGLVEVYYPKVLSYRVVSTSISSRRQLSKYLYNKTIHHLILVQWVNVLSNCASAIGLLASKSLPSWRIKLSFKSHFSFFKMFYVVTTGSFGVEDSIQAAEPILVFKGLLGYLFTWSVRGALVELGTMFLETESYVVWKWIIWDQIWFCGIIGICPEFESFKDHSLTAIPSRLKRTCRESEEFNLSYCKRKLIGARWYIKDYGAEFGSLYTKGVTEFLSARDAEGRGTHTSSITAGDMVENVSFFGLAKGGTLSASWSVRHCEFWYLGVGSPTVESWGHDSFNRGVLSCTRLWRNRE